MNNKLIKTPMVLFNVVVFLFSISLSGYAQRGGQSIQQSQLNDLKRIGVMVGQGKPNSDVQEAWKKTIIKYKDINIDNAISSILSEAKLEAQRNVDAAKKRVLNSIGDDAQLANVDLQNSLQKQQQLLQMLSNISKILSDTAMAVVRKIGG